MTHFASVGKLVRLKSFNFCSNSPADAGKPIAIAASKPVVRPPLQEFQRARLRSKVAAITCSTPWTEVAASAAEIQGIDPNLVNIPRVLRDRGIYPPRPDAGPANLPRIGAVRMRRCDGCGRLVPPNNVASYRLIRLCDDCRIEPDTDPDVAVDRPDIARTPGVQLHTLMEGLVDDDANRHDARSQLRQLGLTDPQIMAMSLMHAGYSTRHIAELGRWSQTYVFKLLTSAAKKLRRSGLTVPTAKVTRQTHRLSTLDPAKLDAMSDRVR